ncbi:hypothetical protein SDJN03_26175, partial [Cucurbita argyrosperma subsp. sororia]
MTACTMSACSSAQSVCSLTSKSSMRCLKAKCALLFFSSGIDCSHSSKESFALCFPAFLSLGKVTCQRQEPFNMFTKTSYLLEKGGSISRGDYFASPEERPLLDD